MSVQARLLAALLLPLCVASGIASAQTANDPPAASPAAPAPPVVPTPAAQSDESKAMVRQAFGRVDSNKDGRLTHEEANALPPVAAKFDQLDTDKDGVISEDEFIAGVRIGG